MKGCIKMVIILKRDANKQGATADGCLEREMPKARRLALEWKTH